MRFPTLNELPSSREVQDVFAGLNQNLRIGNNEFSKMKNMTGEKYPLLSTRAPRGYDGVISNPGGLITKDAIAIVSGSKIIYNGHDIEMGLTAGEKQLVSMGAYLLIWPDKKWLNTEQFSENGIMENEFKASGSTTVTLCKQDGSDYGDYKIAATAPEKPKDNDLWMDTSGTSPSLKQYSETSASWVSIATVYLKLKSKNIHSGFNQYDGVTISGFTEDLASLNGSHVLQKVDDADGGSVVIIGILEKKTYTETAKISMLRSVPDMDFVTECDNRIWGCKYGVVNGKPVNEIYACKLGDFKNWNCFQGLSTDSYVASRGSDGVFTGAVTHQGHPLFFKEDCIEKVYPSATGAHQIVTTEARGVQKGCWRSLEIVDETLYYKSRADVCAYTGSLPTSVSAALGETRYSDARAGAEGSLYYISMKDKNSKWHLFVFDTKNGMWHEEDDTKAMMFTSCDGKLWWIDEPTKKLVCRESDSLTMEGKFDWHVETGNLGLDIPENKYISNLLIRANLEEGTSIKIEVQYEHGAWEKKIEYGRAGLRSFNVPVSPHRHDHLKMRISGNGGCKIYSISKHLTQGSEVMW